MRIMKHQKANLLQKGCNYIPHFSSLEPFRQAYNLEHLQLCYFIFRSVFMVTANQQMLQRSTMGVDDAPKQEVEENCNLYAPLRRASRDVYKAWSSQGHKLK